MAEGGLHMLLSQAAGGDERARERAFAELLRLLTIFIRSKMGWRLRDHRESEDVCQSIARSFIEDFGAGQIRFESEGAVVAYLKAVTTTKLALLARHDGAAKRGGGVAHVALGPESASFGAPGPHAPNDGRKPGRAGPAEGERLLRELEAISFVQDRLSAEEQELARLRLAGLEWQEIGARIGRDPAALRKQWSRLVERVSRELGA
jgi:DNA-directed RNA polymerase specialized sigma24 family protein